MVDFEVDNFGAGVEVRTDCRMYSGLCDAGFTGSAVDRFGLEAPSGRRKLDGSTGRSSYFDSSDDGGEVLPLLSVAKQR